MRYFKKFLLIFSIIFFYHNIVIADTPYFLDFKLILNESEAGKKAQTSLKNKLNKGIKNLQDKEKKIQDEEKKIIQQKKVISAEEYKKKLVELAVEQDDEIMERYLDGKEPSLDELKKCNKCNDCNCK